mmetsp:Transcript_5681/g.11578  ORF Transcript_5681/g.11578 Transcript_5681/m.11578 type:complete len:249 (+) Transcript_5681:1041-1787(+)
MLADPRERHHGFSSRTGSPSSCCPPSSLLLLSSPSSCASSWLSIGDVSPCLDVTGAGCCRRCQRAGCTPSAEAGTAAGSTSESSSLGCDELFEKLPSGLTPALGSSPPLSVLVLQVPPLSALQQVPPLSVLQVLLLLSHGLAVRSSAALLGVASPLTTSGSGSPAPSASLATSEASPEASSPAGTRCKPAGTPPIRMAKRPCSSISQRRASSNSPRTWCRFLSSLKGSSTWSRVAQRPRSCWNCCSRA